MKFWIANYDYKIIESIDCDNKYSKAMIDIHKKCNDLINSTNSFNDINKLFDNKNNSSFFYTGIEQKTRDKYNTKFKSISKSIESIIDTKSYFVYCKLTKSKIPSSKNNMSKRLLSCVFLIKPTSNLNTKFSQNDYKLILVPIAYDNFHDD